jgi:hypothetical protein
VSSRLALAIAKIVAATVQAQLKIPNRPSKGVVARPSRQQPLDDSRRILDPTFGARDAHDDA